MSSASSPEQQACSSALAFFGAFGTFLMVFPPGGRLRVEVCEDTIEFQRRRGTPDVVRREEIELIVLEGSPFEGVESFSMYGPGDVRVGNWDTGWSAKSIPQVLRTLKKHGYPCGLRDPLYKNRLFYRSPGRRPDES